MADIRCETKKYGELIGKGSGILEVLCKSQLCKTQQNEVVIHRWNLEKFNANGSVKMIETRRFKDPTKGK